LPAPFVYGWFNYIFNDERAGIKLIMFWGLWAPILLGIGSLYRYKQLKKLDINRVRKSSGHKLIPDNKTPTIVNKDEVQSIDNI